MNCPACAHVLTPIESGAITVFACQDGCAGIWFDRGSVRTVDHGDQPLNPALLQLRRRDGVAVYGDRKRHCPRCAGVGLMRHRYSPQRPVTVDECGNCGGFWLDMGELEAIRSGQGDRPGRPEVPEPATERRGLAQVPGDWTGWSQSYDDARRHDHETPLLEREIIPDDPWKHPKHYTVGDAVFESLWDAAFGLTSDQ